ncbi:ClpXP protease specificity-enhancing factor [Sansalvadorimonas sp. 2012CJ34-2]|uniref:ClpXP protease specificity-enhancing factor n=1 Tax=Parendozoicomonas callyspongiae TaxID=2942213 RepID=A0ABT0PCK3_9GAMM|nr:ClpXP protease specificity-enhancing factor [Sansalvadorimonas sp. 2012CJ34-2]MCL6268986.1 ClpXP protease specificity-enhancing factor [Sansalvadorimonas sp. 2012CJ34-2]
MSMTSSRPYIVRALYDWIVDNECTPYLLVDSHWPGVCVPAQFTEDDQVVLNISPMAVRELDLGNDAVSFMARFGGKSCDVYVPVAAVMAIYARENGQGMVFEMEQRPDSVVQEAVEEKVESPKLESVPSIVRESEPEEEKSDSEAPAEPPRPAKGRPSLKVIK